LDDAEGPLHVCSCHQHPHVDRLGPDQRRVRSNGLSISSGTVSRFWRPSI
jgi:hypothetical protein